VRTGLEKVGAVPSSDIEAASRGRLPETCYAIDRLNS